MGVATAVDAQGNVYIVGNTTSADFPVKNALQPHLGGSPLRFSADGGKTWISAPLSEAIQCAAGSLAGTLYAGSVSGMYKSTDGGKSWTKLKLTGPVTAISVDPGGGSVVAVANSSLMRSTDGGATFTAGPGWYIAAIARSPLKPSNMLAIASNAGVPEALQSSDGGATWNVINQPPIWGNVIAPDPVSAGVWYIAGAGYPGGYGMYKTADNGTTWTKLSDGTIWSISVSPSAIFAASSTGLIESRDGGVTWTATSLGAPVTQVAVDPANPQTVWAAAGLIYMSADGGAHWTTALPVRQGGVALAVLPGSAAAVGAATSQNLFVTKWTGDGQQMLYSTFIGGSLADYASGIAVDPSGNAYVTGFTYSNDFPVTAGAYQTRTSATYSPFALKISADGKTLAYATYLGGSNADAAFAIAADAAGHAYLTGFAGSPDFPVTGGAFHSHGGLECTPDTPGAAATFSPGAMFASKLSPDGSSLLYSGIAAGSCGEQGESLAVDSAGNAYIAGSTLSTDFPVTADATEPVTGAGVSTGFLMKVSPQGGMLYSTFIGGAFGSTADAIALDSSGSPYLTGCSAGFDNAEFTGGSSVNIAPVTSSGFSPPLLFPGINPTCPGAAYVVKFSGTSRSYLKYLGASFGDGYAVAVDSGGRAWISGTESASDPNANPFPLVHPFEAWLSDGFVAELSADGGTLLFSSNSDANGNVALDASGNAFVTGQVSTDTPDTASTLVNGNVAGPAVAAPPSNGLLARIDASIPAAATAEVPAPVGFFEPQDPAFLGIAPGQLMTISGTGLGPAQAVQAQIADGRLPTTLAGTTVTFDSVPAPLISVQANQIECLVPFEVGLNAIFVTSMQVSSGVSVSNSIKLPVQTTEVEILAVINQDGKANSASHPAAPGSIVTVYASGFGWTDPPGIDGQINGTAPATPDGGPFLAQFPSGSNAKILYAGPAPGQVAGIFQVNFVVPAGNSGAPSVLFGPEMVDSNGDPLIDAYGYPIGPGILNLFVGQ